MYHVVDVLEPGADDTADITPYAVAHDLAIVTKDTDFLEMDTSDHEGVFFIGDHHVPAYEIAMAIARIAEAVPDRDDLRDVIFVDSWLS